MQNCVENLKYKKNYFVDRTAIEDLADRTAQK